MKAQNLFRRAMVVLLFVAPLWAGLLHEHAKEGDVESVVQLLKQGADAGEADEEEGLMPLHVAGRYGHLEVARTLLDHGADIDAKSVLVRRVPKHISEPEEGLTALHYASRHGHLDLVKLLVARGANVRSTGPGHFRVLPFHSAAEGSQKEVVDYFITEHKISPRTTVTLKGRGFGNFSKSKLNAIQVALLHSKLRHDKSPLPPEDKARLFAFVKHMESKGVGVPPNMPTEYNPILEMTLPMVASYIGSVGLLQYLVEAKGLAPSPPAGTTNLPKAIHMAATGGSLDAVKYLLSKGERLDMAYTGDGEAVLPVHFAAYGRHKEGTTDVIEFVLSEMALDRATLQELQGILRDRNKKRALGLVESALAKAK